MSVCVAARDRTGCILVLVTADDGPAAQLGEDVSKSSHQHLCARDAICASERVTLSWSCEHSHECAAA